MIINKLILVIKNLKMDFHLYSLIFFSIISSFLEILSISSIIPIMAIIIDINILSKFPILGKPVRFILTNNYHGPSITDIFMILGKRNSLERLNKYKI